MKYLIETTKFSMAQQDIRYYLNGILFEIKEKTIRSVSTDGHRLSICSVKINELLPHHFMILPRKGVIELLRLLDNSETLIELQIGNNNIRIILNNIIFTSKLIDGNFPNYKQILYKNYKKTLEAPCELLKQAFLRTAILSNKKLLVTKLFFSKNQLKITSNNIEQEIAEEIIDIIYNDVDTEIHLNINYILDILNTIKSKKIQFLFNDAYSSVLIKNPENNNLIYIVMPIRL
ncbi:Beta sliding clamp [isoform beta*] [Candidatus Providencia siddallii]|uniref:Beta sliding clamp n=1 Tax=Candidatus Providencia siddallii TaxID=1715285 RepID=A0ABP1CD65_9GAMM